MLTLIVATSFENNEPHYRRWKGQSEADLALNGSMNASCFVTKPLEDGPEDFATHSGPSST